MAAPKQRRWSNYSFTFLFLVVLALFLWVISPFLVPVLIAAFIVVIAYPLQQKLRDAFHGKRKLAASLMSVLVFLIVVLPSLGLAFAFVLQSIDLLNSMQEALGPQGLSGLLQGRVPEALQGLVDTLHLQGLLEQLQQGLSAIASKLASLLTTLLGALTRLGLDLFLWLVAVFFFFSDGERLVRALPDYVPLEKRYLEEFFQEFRQVSRTMLLVNVVTALAQGALGALGFVIAGLQGAIVWGALIAFLSLVPVVGPPLIWFPAGLYLLLSGHLVAGIFLLAWGLLVVGTIDNFLRPFLAKGGMRLHPLLVFLTIFGGLAVFGAIGVVLGPLIGAIFTAMVRIWKSDFIPRAKEAGSS